MGSYQKIFKRVEKKYILSKEKYEQLMENIKEQLEENEYPNSKILNLYYDTQNYDLAIKSIQKPAYKEKLRLRSYNIPSLEDKVFFELKRKSLGVVSKRRIGIKLKDYEKYMISGKLEEVESKQIFDEIEYTIKKYDLLPKMMVAYDRESYYLKENEEIRVTFDFNLRSRTDNLDLKMGDAGVCFFDEDKCIMEIKSCIGLPIWFVRVLNDLKIYPTSFSKYGEIYKKTICKKGMV